MTYFTPSSSVTIVISGQVNFSWENTGRTTLGIVDKKYNGAQTYFASWKSKNVNQLPLRGTIKVWNINKDFYLEFSEEFSKIIRIVISVNNFGTFNVPCITESCIEIKIELNLNQVKFLFSHFFVVPQKVLWRPLRPS